MNYILFNADGSVNTQHLDYYIMQGSTGVNEIFVSIADTLITNTTIALFSLPNQTTSTQAGVYQADYEYAEGLTANGWLITLTSTETLYNGLLRMSVLVYTGTTLLLTTYPIALVVNETGYRPDADTGVTIEEINTYLQQLQSYALLADVEDRFLPLIGGTMSGAIVQPVAPVVNYDLANKKYVDDSVKVATDDIANIIDGDLIVHTAYHAMMDANGRNLVDLAKTSDLTDGTITVDKADKATKDASGNVITSTYATKVENALKQNISDKGQADGYASLDGTGKVPSTQLPAYVDDVLEFANFASFPATGTSGIIYVDLYTDLQYRWSGTSYTIISKSVGLGETPATAYRGDRGKIAYDHSQLTSGNPHNVTASETNFDNTIKNLLTATKVQGAIDELSKEVLAVDYEEVTHTSLQSEITATDLIEIKDDSGEIIRITGNTIPSEDIPTLKALGIKNDEGVLFSALTNEEITEQLGIWAEQGYPTHINKLISKSDNLFNGKFNTLTSLESENIIANSDLLTPKASPNENQPLGFTYENATDITLVNGIAKFTATAQFGAIRPSSVANFNSSDTFYSYANFKSDSNSVGLATSTGAKVSHSGSGNFEFHSTIGVFSNLYLIGLVTDHRTSGWTPIEVDYIGAINITDLVSRGILPSGLTNLQYKEMLDNAIFDNVPLRESDFISVEPSVAYRLIKASENSAIHKVIEYTTDNQIVKVRSVNYSGNVKISSPITMNALTRKIKLVSDLMDRPNVEITNRFFTSTSSWTVWNGTGSVANGIYTVVGNPDKIYCSVYQDNPTTIGNLYYISGEFMTPNSDISSIVISGNYNNYPIANTWYKKSYLRTASGTAERLEFILYHATSISGKTINVRNPLRYNITDFINKGVVNDNGTLFSRLTNSEIKDQMDIWTEVGFPDHVINALYPDGADTAISLKYNDGDAIYYPQVIDELPLDITLRSGEYWQDGYIVKANGNAEASQLGKVFSAWNYGQIEAIYDSGVPADFKVKYAQNTSAQVSTHSEYLKEARKTIDTLRTNQEQLIGKLGLVEEEYDSYAGITSSEYEYFGLEGVKEGNQLAIEGYGQSIQNLLGKSGTVTASQVVRGVTVTYDSATGVFTANGTATAGTAFNITLATGMDFALPTGTSIQLMRYYDAVDGGTLNLNGSYIGYVLMGTSVSNRINENSEALYDPYINGSGALTPNHVTNKQQLLLQVWKEGIVFTNFKFKVGIYQGLQLRPFILPSGEPAKSNVSIYNKTANKLNLADAILLTDSGVTITYDPLLQEFLLSGTASATKDISLTATFDVLSGDRLSIKRQYQSGDITDAGGVLPRIKLIDGATTVVYNDIYKMTAPEGVTPTPDISFNTGTASADGTVTLKLGITSGQIFDNYRFRLMIHDKSSDIGYVKYEKDYIGSMLLNADEKSVLTFNAIPFGILEFVAESNSLNLLFSDSISDLRYTILEYNAGIGSPNRKISVLDERASAIDEPFRNKVVAIWGDSRESNNPTSDPSGVGDQKDTSYPALLAKKLHATVLNFGLSGGAWAENTVQQDAGSAIVNRVLTEDASASADVIIISSMNDFKLYTTLGSPLPANKDKTTFYGAIRLTFDRLANKYPGKKIWVVLPQKRFDESTNYGGGLYIDYRKAQLDVCREYGIPTIDLYNNFPNSKTTAVSGGVTFYATNMLNDTHFSAVGNDLVAELITRALIGNGNSGVVDILPPYPTTDGTYTLKVTITSGVPVFSWILGS